MRENRTYGLEGGEPDCPASLPLSIIRPGTLLRACSLEFATIFESFGITRSISVVAKLAKSFGARSLRKSWRLPLQENRTVIDRTVLGGPAKPSRSFPQETVSRHVFAESLRCYVMRRALPTRVVANRRVRSSRDWASSVNPGP